MSRCWSGIFTEATWPSASRAASSAPIPRSPTGPTSNPPGRARRGSEACRQQTSVVARSLALAGTARTSTARSTTTGARTSSAAACSAGARCAALHAGSAARWSRSAAKPAAARRAGSAGPTAWAALHARSAAVATAHTIAATVTAAFAEGGASARPAAFTLAERAAFTTLAEVTAVATLAEVTAVATLAENAAFVAPELTPAMPADRAAPAEADPQAVAAAIPARAMPAVVIEAVATALPAILHILGDRDAVDGGEHAAGRSRHHGSGSSTHERRGAAGDGRDQKKFHTHISLLVSLPREVTSKTTRGRAFCSRETRNGSVRAARWSRRCRVNALSSGTVWMLTSARRANDRCASSRAPSGTGASRRRPCRLRRRW